MIPESPFASMNVPIVNQPFTLHDIQFCVVMTCKCQPDNAPFTIMGINIAVGCVKCKRTYVISKATFDRSASLLNGEVAVVSAQSPSVISN